MELEKGKNEKSSSRGLFDNFEVCVNTVNHALIGITTFYITWYSFTVGFVEYQTYHAFFTTIGYQLFMSEGILAMNRNNTYTMGMRKKYKVRVHLALMAFGGACGLFGIPYQMYQRQITNRAHLHNTHGIVGEFAEKNI